ncbi:unnamed protein product [Prorocentrum cordatum]|uniref:Uncharacterized protein n=1 Tax=Prorocentrum cordatum TaxID=2364126 RepID=A0ABN9T2U8_9DINO|nr:unnamed protein product [Polarella glacialis]
MCPPSSSSPHVAPLVLLVLLTLLDLLPPTPPLFSKRRASGASRAARPRWAGLGEARQTLQARLEPERSIFDRASLCGTRSSMWNILLVDVQSATAAPAAPALRAPPCWTVRPRAGGRGLSCFFCVALRWPL